MFSVKEYPYPDRYYSRKGQVLQRKTIETRGPLTPQQLKKAYDYFIATNQLSSPSPSLDTNLYLFYVQNFTLPVLASKLININDFITPSSTYIITPSRYQNIIFAVINNNYPNRIYFLQYYKSQDSNYSISVPTTYRYIELISPSDINPYSGGVLFLNYFFYLPVTVLNASVAINATVLTSFPYVTVST